MRKPQPSAHLSQAMESKKFSKLEYAKAWFEMVTLCAKLKLEQNPNTKTTRFLGFLSRPWVAFAVGTTVGYPIEHYLYTKVPPFTYVAQWLGLQ